MRKVAIDFGTTNTVIALWDERAEEARTLHLGDFADSSQPVGAALIPSRISVDSGDGSAIRIGGEAPKRSDDPSRFFHSFKRGIGGGSETMGRVIDGIIWDDRKAAESFLMALISKLHEEHEEKLDELVLTVPVASFEGYLAWLKTLTEKLGGLARRVRVIDECTAAALGYAYRSGGEYVMVFDFGGGTLDISIVRMPTGGESGGILLGRGASEIPAHAVEARVIAKAGRILGGDDIDTLLIEHVMKRAGLSRHEGALNITVLKEAVESAKIQLSDAREAEIVFLHPETEEALSLTITRSDLETLLDEGGILQIIRRTVESVLRSARQVGIYPEDLGALLMVGGSSIIPIVRDLMRAYVDAEKIHSEKPFEAVAHGALELAAGLGVSDFIYHSYAVRYLNPLTEAHEWEEIIPSGTRYPDDEGITLVLAASRDGQTGIELVIGERAEAATSLREVIFGGSRLQVISPEEVVKVVPLNDSDEARMLAYLDPPGKTGTDRIEVKFTIDVDRFLRATVRDLRTRKILSEKKPLIELS